MDRSFVIAQISDLHLDGSGRLLATIEALAEALRERMTDFSDVPDRILLITGDIDNNVHPSNTYRLADALIKANKRFDMMVLPGQRHGYTTFGEYVTWMRADYFAKHLLGDYDQSVDMWEINR